jgi:hypothetical protein
LGLGRKVFLDKQLANRAIEGRNSLLQQFATEGLEAVAIGVAAGLRRDDSMMLAEVLAPVAIPHVELISNDREPHRVSTVQKLAILDRVEPEVQGNVRGPASVPARPVPHFRLRHKD